MSRRASCNPDAMVQLTDTEYAYTQDQPGELFSVRMQGESPAIRRK